MYINFNAAYKYQCAYSGCNGHGIRHRFGGVSDVLIKPQSNHFEFALIHSYIRLFIHSYTHTYASISSINVWANLCVGGRGKSGKRVMLETVAN